MEVQDEGDDTPGIQSPLTSATAAVEIGATVENGREGQVIYDGRGQLYISKISHC